MHRNMRAAVLGTALTLFASACSSTASSTAGTPSTPAAAASVSTIKVGLITKFPVDFYDTMVKAVKDWAATNPNVQVLYASGKSGTDDASEIAAIQDMVTKGVKAIAITPTSPNVQGALDAAIAAGVKVVLIDNDIPGWNGKSSVVATDNKAGGVLAGKWIAAKVKSGAKVAVLQCALAAQSLTDRWQGMQEGLGSAGTIVAKGVTDCDQTKGQQAMQDILTAHPDVNVVFGAGGPPTLGAIQAIKGAGKKPADITIVGFDAGPDEVKAIVAGDEAASVAQFPAKMGSLGISTAVDAAMGKTVPKNVDTGTAVVEKSNAAQFGG